MDFGILEILITLAAIFLAFYKYITWSYDYWSSRGVSGPKPTAPFGNFADIFLRRKPLCAKLQEIYDSTESEPFIGYYAGNHPILMIKDPDLIKNVLIKDFNVFAGRGIRINETCDPLSAHLFNIDGERWKVLRQKLTPVFTTGKLRNMFTLMSECADNFESYLKEQVRKNDVMEFREIAARYSTDVIGSCAFGINAQALEDENSIFRAFGRKIFEPSLIVQFKRLMREISPRLYSLLRLSTVTPEVTKFFIDTMRETVELRKRENTVRNDFIDMLMQIPKDSKTDGFEWTDHLLTAQAFVFFAAGFETSSTTISFALWELSRTPEVQEKLRREIIEFHTRNEGLITYDSVNDMKYMDMVVKETLRKNPPVVVLVRKSMKNYTIPGTKVTIPAGQRVQIPAYSLHRDSKYYQKPEVFDPERFTDEAKRTRHPMVFLPFGDGPKNCIGARFGYYQVKLALIKILKNFRVEPTTTSSNGAYIVDKNAVILSPVGGIVLKFVPL